MEFKTAYSDFNDFHHFHEKNESLLVTLISFQKRDILMIFLHSAQCCPSVL